MSNDDNKGSWFDIIFIIIAIVWVVAITISLFDHLWACHHEYFMREWGFWK